MIKIPENVKKLGVGEILSMNKAMTMGVVRLDDKPTVETKMGSVSLRVLMDIIALGECLDAKYITFKIQNPIDPFLVRIAGIDLIVAPWVPDKFEERTGKEMPDCER